MDSLVFLYCIRGFFFFFPRNSSSEISRGTFEVKRPTSDYLFLNFYFIFFQRKWSDFQVCCSCLQVQRRRISTIQTRLLIALCNKVQTVRGTDTQNSSSTNISLILLFFDLKPKCFFQFHLRCVVMGCWQVSKSAEEMLAVVRRCEYTMNGDWAPGTC